MGIGARLDHLHPLQVDRILRQLFHERFAHRVMAVALPVEDAAHLRFTGIQGMGEEGLRHAFRMRSGIAVRLKDRLGERRDAGLWSRAGLPLTPSTQQLRLA